MIVAQRKEIIRAMKGVMIPVKTEELLDIKTDGDLIESLEPLVFSESINQRLHRTFFHISVTMQLINTEHPAYHQPNVPEPCSPDMFIY
jgi:hypothetical protein